MKNHLMNRRFLLLFSVILLAFVAAGCGSRSSSPTKGEAIVYVAVPLSGFQANGGQTVLGGVRLAAAQINLDGGLLGYKVVVRPLDDESDSDVAVANVEQIRQAIANGDKVIAVIGHLNSGQTLAAMDLYKDMSIVVITPTASEESLTKKGYTNFFRVNANDSVQAAVDAAFLTGDLKAKSVAVVNNDTEYGQGLAGSLIRELEKDGASVAVKLEVKEGQSQYSREVDRIKTAGPDAIFYAGYETETPYLRASLVEAGVKAPMLASDGAFLATTIDEAGGMAEGMYVSAFAPSPANVADASWIEAYQAVEYRNPDTYSVNGYVAMQVLADGVRKANSLDSAKVANAIRTNTLDTLLGGLQYNPDGDLVKPQIWIYQVVHNEFKQIK